MILIKQEAAQKAKDANKVINVDFDQGRWKDSKGITSLMESGDIKVGKAPKTPPYEKSQADIEFEIIERIKADNKKAVEAFEKRNPKPPKKFFYGGFVEQPELGPTAHGSEALASRTRLAAPGSTSTTSTGLNYLLAEDNDNQRVPFKMGRRAFLKLMGGAAAGIGALKTGALKLFGKEGATVAKELTQVPIKDISGMPAWFKPLVNKVIKEGTDVTKQNAYKERLIVHKTKLPESKTDVYVNQDLDSGDVWVDIGMEKHGFADGHLGQPVRLEYKASEVIEPEISKTGKLKSKGGKTQEEFNVEEAEFTGGHPENIKFEESVTEKFGNHGSNFDEVEMFATGKIKKAKPLKKRETTQWKQGRAEADADAAADAAADMADDFASGGRAGYAEGTPKLKLYPRASGMQSEQEVGPGIKISERDLNYGITGLLEGDKFFGGAELDKGKVKIDVLSPEGDTLFKDTIGKKDAVNFILGMGDSRGEKFQIKTDKDFDNVQFVLKKSFADGGLAKLLGE